MKSEVAATQNDLTDIVLNSGIFDPVWYARNFPDVALSDLEPATHFARYGQWLGRGVSDRRKSLDDTAPVIRALRTKRRISYCIPVMNRPDDIRWTLRGNLEANRGFAKEIEFIVLFLDNDTATQDWVRTEFADELRSGYLRLIMSPPLTHWHFGRAKNRFRDFMAGDVYSSLDGDNFVTVEETAQLLHVAEQYGDNFIFHHFSGNWGDGTSGRISLPRHFYEEVGYDEQLLPRQFDEVDMLISIMVRYHGVTLVHYETKDDIFISKRMQDFLTDRPRLPPRRHIVGGVARKTPANPRGADYVKADDKMRAMLSFNQLVCFWKNAVPSRRGRFILDIFRARHQLIDALARRDLMPQIVSPISAHKLPAVKPGELSLFACVKNDEQYLPAFYDHYKKLGVSHFFIVDDGSTVPVHSVLKQRDVHVFRPQVGVFATSKGLWLGALIKHFLDEGMWGLTVDADEFLDATATGGTLHDVVTEAEAHGLPTVPALLLDMVPNRDLLPLVRRDTAELLAAFDSHAMVEAQPTPSYTGHSSIKWGFGPYASVSWALDTRYHAFGTFDSLRKLPLFRYRAHLHLNQGFHDLMFSDKTPALGHAIWSYPTVLPLRHFKMVKVFEKEMFQRTQVYLDSNANGYHERTAKNMTYIFGSGQEGATLALEKVPLMPYSPAAFATRMAGLRGRR